MELASARPRPPRPLRGRPLVKLFAPKPRNLRPLSGGERRGLARRADQYSEQEIGRFPVEPGERYQPSQVGKVMDSNPLFARVFAHDPSHHVTTGWSAPRMLVSGMGPK